MEIIIPAVIYLVIVGCIAVRLLTGPYRSNKAIIKTIAITVTSVFAVYLAWELVDFLRNQHEKSFTVGWFALIYLFLTSFTAFAAICWMLRLVRKRIQS